MARLPQQAEVFSRIVLNDDGNMNSIFEVLLHGFDDGDPATQRHIEDVAARFRPQPNPVPRLYSGTPVANGSVKLQQLLGGKRFGALEQQAFALSASAHFLLFGVAERKDSQRQDFV